MNIGGDERMQLLREIGDLRQDFERLYLADAKGKIETHREATLSRSAIPKPSMTFAQLHNRNSRNQATCFGGGEGVELKDKQPQTIEEWQAAPTFYARRTGEPILNSACQSLVLLNGWTSFHNYELSGSHANETEAAIMRTNKWVWERRKFVKLALFPERNTTFRDGFCWPDVVLQAAEQGDATSTLTQWKVGIGAVEFVENADGIETLQATCNRRFLTVSVELWNRRHDDEWTWNSMVEPFASITKADELYIGDEPEIYYCERDMKTFLRDSELALDWLSRRVQSDTKPIATKAVKSKSTKKAGRNPVTKPFKNKDEKNLWSLHKDKGQSAAIIASNLSMDREDVQRTLNTISKRKKRITERENSDA